MKLPLLLLPMASALCPSPSTLSPILTSHNTTLLSLTSHPAHSYTYTYPSTTLNITNTHPFCFLTASIPYGSSGRNNLTFSVFLPPTHLYQNRFMAVGNGGMAGTIDEYNMLLQLNSGLGFAVAGGNAGHLAALNNNGSGEPGVYLPYLHDPEQVEAWIHDALAIFPPVAKAVVEGVYEEEVRWSYYDGCSTGGAQGFALVERWPELFDGVVAGSPGNWYSRLALDFLWGAQVTETKRSYLSQAVLNFTTAAILEACDALDGVADGVIENPLLCNFDLTTLACNSTSNSTPSHPTCLTLSHLSTIHQISSGPVSSTNHPVYPGFSPGSEIEWLLQEGPLSTSFSVPILQNLVYDNLSYSASDFQWTPEELHAVHAKAGRHIDAISPNLTAFHNIGGKLLITQGWADPYNAALWPIQHLQEISDFFNGDVGDWVKLFMIPGGGHCGAAQFYPQVPAKYRVVEALIGWVEKGEAPEDGIESYDAPDGSGRTRRLCAWPETARFVGGDSESWESYVCG